MNQIGVGDCINDGWNGFKKNAGVCIGVILIYAIITSIGGAIPGVNVGLSLLITPILNAGLAIFALKIVRGQDTVVHYFVGNRLVSPAGAIAKIRLLGTNIESDPSLQDGASVMGRAVCKYR